MIFGVPNNFGTVAALAGAGITVAMKDFIVGFFGWFILMGKNGIHPGDWVEINGVGGEVLEVGLLHTVLLETGSWADAGHPTGRKVTFVNSYAIEGHYFNFSTSGQWLWDELQIQVPSAKDPFATAEAIREAGVGCDEGQCGRGAGGLGAGDAGIRKGVVFSGAVDERKAGGRRRGRTGAVSHAGERASRNAGEAVSRGG